MDRFIFETTRRVSRVPYSTRLDNEIELLQLREGDEIEVEVADTRAFRIARDPTREAALAQLRALSRPLPAGFRFSRDEASGCGDAEGAGSDEPVAGAG